LSDLLLICKQIDARPGARYIPWFRMKLERLFLVDPAVELKDTSKRGKLKYYTSLNENFLLNPRFLAALKLELVESSVAIKTVVFATPEEKAEWAKSITVALSKCQLTYQDNEKQFLYKYVLTPAKRYFSWKIKTFFI